MLYRTKWFWILASAFCLAIARGQTSGPSTDPAMKDVTNHLALLHREKLTWDADNADLAAARLELDAVKQGTPGAHTAVQLQARIDVDENDIQVQAGLMLGDLQFLQRQWNLLSQTDRDFVSIVEKLPL